MDILVGGYLAKQFQSGPSKSKLISNLQGEHHSVIERSIEFSRLGPQVDPWVEQLASKHYSKPLTNGAKRKFEQEEHLSNDGDLGEKVTAKIETKNGTQSPQDDSFRQNVIIRANGGRGQVGLTNVGNTCYFNAILQCLTNCAAFYNYLCSDAHDKSKCRMGDSCVICLLKQFCGSHLPHRPNQKVVSGAVLRDILTKMKKVVRKWKIHSQQSADEILAYLLDSLCERDMAYFGVKAIHTPMFNIFGTVIQQQYTCSICGASSISNGLEPTIILGLVNGDTRSVQERLKMEYGREETLTEPKDKCDFCNRKRTPRPTMKRVLRTLPMVLVVMLKRFFVIDGSSYKINQFVSFPEILDLKPCMDSKSKLQANSPEYRLTGIVEHLGSSVHDGHYVAFCKSECPFRKEERWYFLNDTRVETIPLKEVLKKRAYLLFYTLEGMTSKSFTIPRGNSAKMNKGQIKKADNTSSVKREEVKPNLGATPSTIRETPARKIIPFNGAPSPTISIESSSMRTNNGIVNEHKTPMKWGSLENGKSRVSIFDENLVKKKTPPLPRPIKTLVPYDVANSSDDDSQTVALPTTSSSLTSLASSSANWAVDKISKTPSITSNSSQNSTHSTSQGWTVSSTKKENSHVIHQRLQNVICPPSKATTNGVSYWGVSDSEARDERSGYNFSLDQGRQKKQHNHKNRFWRSKDYRAGNPFQTEQEIRSRGYTGNRYKLGFKFMRPNFKFNRGGHNNKFSNRNRKFSKC